MFRSTYIIICICANGTLAEVMMTYDQKDKILFSADGFGKFGANDVKEDWMMKHVVTTLVLLGNMVHKSRQCLKKLQL